jgi:hypothetical protein
MIGRSEALANEGQFCFGFFQQGELLKTTLGSGLSPEFMTE